ncbi:hypothetical protein [Roseiflexus castenholzii]|nr:hypothetical protein [Roseiflexus castenholzii]
MIDDLELRLLIIPLKLHAIHPSPASTFRTLPLTPDLALHWS